MGNIDDQSFNQSSYEGMVAYAEENGLTYAYYRPSEDSDEARLEQIHNAVSNGAKVVILPGYFLPRRLPRRRPPTRRGLHRAGHRA